MLGPIFLIVLLAVCSGVSAEETPAVEPLGQKHAADLGSDEFAVREAATSALRKLGKEALPALRALRRNSRNPEAKDRAGKLINEIYDAHPELALRITLEPSEQKVVRGSGAELGVRILFENLSDDPQVIIRPRKGSIEEGRTPAYRFEFVNNTGVRSRPTGRGASINVRAEENADPFKPEYFVTIPPGEKLEVATAKISIDRLSSSADTFSKKENWTVSMTYIVPQGIAGSEVILEPLGNQPATLELLHQARKCQLVSEPATIEIAPKKSE